MVTHKKHNDKNKNHKLTTRTTTFSTRTECTNFTIFSSRVVENKLHKNRQTTEDYALVVFKSTEIMYNSNLQCNIPQRGA